MPQRDVGAAVRVGFTVLVGLLVLAIAIFLVGERQFLFSRKNSYYIELENVANLTVGNPVQLNGVTVGKVDDIVLPETTEATVQVWITVDRRFAQRIREDSMARIQTLGLLGDKYIAINSGSTSAAVVEPGGQIKAAPATEIDQLLASGGDVVDNLSVAASSLSNILSRMERGEGLLGALVADRGNGQTLNDSVTGILTDLRDVLSDIKKGKGSLGRLLYDDQLASDLEGAVGELEQLAQRLNQGDGLVPALVSDPALKDRFVNAIGNLEKTSGELETMVGDLGNGNGLLPRMMKDEAMADELTNELRAILKQLDEVTTKLNRGDGAAAKLLNDPAVYDAISDILVGINESRMLRWLIRNRQKAGIRERYQDAQGSPDANTEGHGTSDHPEPTATPPPG